MTGVGCQERSQVEQKFSKPQLIDTRPIAAGHVDGVCAFVRSGVLLVATTHDQAHEDYELYESIFAQLDNATDARGRPF